MIIKSSRELEARFDELRPGDIFMGIFSMKHLRQAVLIDLLERGIHCIPSPLSQTLNRSKTAQAFVLKEWMLPQTRVIRRRSDLIRAVNRYNEAGIGPVISKEAHMHCGHGIRKWDNIEAAYSHMALSDLSYPFVLQPYIEKFTDIRVIIVGDYVESYARYNPYNFRVNLSSGGKSRGYTLDRAQVQFCRSVMKRANFPFAHIDLMVMDNGECYFSEIALNGGTKGARIGRKDLERKKQAMLESLAENLGK
jgi:ribosomal protein S6--L-glutamate ligase